MVTKTKKKQVDTKKKAINLRIDLDLHKRLEAVSESQKRSLHSQVIWMLESYLNKTD